MNCSEVVALFYSIRIKCLCLPQKPYRKKFDLPLLLRRSSSSSIFLLLPVSLRLSLILAVHHYRHRSRVCESAAGNWTKYIIIVGLYKILTHTHTTPLQTVKPRDFIIRKPSIIVQIKIVPSSLVAALPSSCYSVPWSACIYCTRPFQSPASECVYLYIIQGVSRDI